MTPWMKLMLYKQKNCEKWYYKFKWQGRLIRGATGTENRGKAELVLAAKRLETMNHTPPKPPRATLSDLARWKTWLASLSDEDQALAQSILDRINPTLRAGEAATPTELTLISELDREPQVPIQSGGKALTLRELADLWCQARKKKKSLKSDQYRFKKLLADFGEETPINSLTANSIEDWRAQQSQLKSNTQNRYLVLLKSALSLAAKRGYTTQNPFQTITFGEEHSRDRVLEESEYLRLLNAAEGELKIAVRIGYETGMRLEEIATMTAAQVKDDYIYIPKTKNGEARAIPLTPELKHELATFGGFQYTKETISRQYARLCKEQKVEGTRFHDLRATFTTRMLKAGLDVTTVAKLTGHKTISVIQKHYARFCKEDLLEARLKAERKKR